VLFSAKMEFADTELTGGKVEGGRYRRWKWNLLDVGFSGRSAGMKHAEYVFEFVASKVTHIEDLCYYFVFSSR